MNVSSAALAMPKSNYSFYNHNFKSSLAFNDSLAFRGVNNSIADIFFIVYNGSDSQSPYSAYEASLEWCVRDYTTTVTNGIASTQRVNEYRGFVGPIRPAGAQLSHRGVNYTVELATAYSLQLYFQTLFNGMSVAVGPWLVC